uniref:Transcription factor TFIIIB component B'' homolog isoform X2 n=1 Tax=Geotrypetes seraphini TaxID=260995 RepID=A0A6P8P6J7_GEOSA|nr:transcription factor TFIIIB component B'' homolog isoform X2 [Geotrypetes seraphini]
MFRRARLNVRPNVKPGGRVAATVPASSQPEDGNTSGAPTESVPSTGELPTPNCDVGSRDSPGEVVAAVAPPPVSAEGREEKPVNDAEESTKPSVTALQRRKRIATAPNLAKPRGSLPSVQRADTAALSSSQEQTPEHLPSNSAPIKNVLPQPEKSSSEASPRSAAKTVSFMGQGHVLPEKKTPVPQVPHFSPFKKSARKELNVRTSAERGDEVPQKDTLSPLKERPSQASSGPGEIKVCPKATPPKKIQHGSDRKRILKAQKLRELLREELKKERKLWREKHPVFENSTPVDHSKMIMRDFIYYLPESNPMKSSFTEEKMVEKSCLAPVTVKEPQIRSTPPEPDLEDEEVEEEAAEEDADGSLLVPRVKVAEDGTIILDEESLTVEVLRTKGSAVVEENDPIFERGSTTTYSSFRKSCYSKPWSIGETDMFYLAISMVGTDFSMIGQLFPHRARTEIKNKFKREERSNSWRIDKAFKEKQQFDPEFFAELLHKVLNEDKKRKQKSAKITNNGVKKPAKTRTKQKAKEVGFSSNDRGTFDTEAVEMDTGSAEKENEESPSVHESQAAAEPGRPKKKKRKKKKSEDPSSSVAEKPSGGNEVSEKSTSTERIRNKKGASAVEDTGDSGNPIDSCGVSECLEEQENLLVESEESQYSLPGNEETENTGEQHSSTSKQSSLSEHDESSVSDASKSSRSQTLHPSKSKIKISEKRDRREAVGDTDGAKTQSAEVCDQISSTEDSTIAERSQETQENEKKVTCAPVKAVRGWVQKPKPNLAQASRKKELPSHPEPTEIADKNAGEVDALNITVEKEKKNEDTAMDLKSDDRLDIPCQKKEDALTPRQLRRSQFQRPKPNLSRASGRKEAPQAAVIAVEEKHEAEKSGTLIDDGSDYSLLPTSLHTSLDQEQSLRLLDDSNSTEDKVSKRLQSPEKSSRNMGKPESKEKAFVENILELPAKEHIRSDEEPDFPCQNKGDDVKPGQLRRGRFQKPKPNLGRATGRKETLLAKEVAIEEKHEAEKSGTLLGDGGGCSSLPTSHLDLLAKEYSPCLLNDSKCTDLTEKIKGSERLQSTQKSPSIMGKPDSEEMADGENILELAEKEHLRFDKEPDGPCQSKGDTVKPGQLRRSRFQKVKPNLSRASERKETPVAEVTTVERKPEAEKSGALLNDGSSCSLLPISHALQQEGNVPFLPSVSLEKYELTDSLQAVQTPLSLCSENMQSPARLIESKDEIEQKVESQMDHTVGKIMEVCQRSSEEPSPQAESKLSVPKPAPIRRGRFQKPKPNLVRAVERKGTALGEKGAAEDKTEAETTVKHVVDGCNSDHTVNDAAKCEKVLASPSAKPLDSDQVTLITRSPKPFSYTPVEDCEFTEDSPSADAQRNTFGAVARTDVKLVAQEESTVDVLQSRKLRGRFVKLKPNLGRGAVRKEESAAKKKNETESSFSLAPSSIGSDSFLSAAHSSCTEEITLSSHMGKRKDPDDSIEVVYLKRRRLLNKPQPLTSSENETFTVQEEDVPASSTMPLAPDKAARLGRQCKQPKPMKAVPASKSEAICEKGRTPQKPKPYAPKGRGSKGRNSKCCGKRHKTFLVTIRALQEEDEDEDDDGDPEQDYEEESYHLPPEEVNKAPVFVPKSLRSPNPVPAEIEETVEELEITADIDADCIPDTKSNLGVQEEFVSIGGKHNTSVEVAPSMASYLVPEEEAEIDGSTEAAMTLLAMRDPMFQSRMNIQGTTFVFNDCGELKDVTPAVLNRYNMKPNVTPVIQPFMPSIIVRESSHTEQEDKGPSAEQSTGVIVDMTEEVKSEIHVPSERSVPHIKNTLSMTSGDFLKSRPILDRALEKPKTETDHIGSQVQSDMEEKAPIGSLAEQDPDKIGWSSLQLHESGPSDTCTGHIVKNERLEESIQEIQETKIESCTLAGSPRPQTYGAESGFMPYHNSEKLHPEENIHLFTDSSCTFALEQVMHEEEHSEAIEYKNLIADLDQTTVHLVTNDYPKEEDTIILTLVEIPVASMDGYHDSDAALPLGSEHMLIAPMIISPVCSELSEGQSTGPMMTAINSHATSSANQSNTSECEITASVMPVFELGPISRKRIACKPEENDVPQVKKKESYFIKDGCEDTPMESTSNQNCENIHFVESQFTKKETAAVSEGTCAVTKQEEQFAPLQTSDTSQLSATSTDGDETSADDDETSADGDETSADGDEALSYDQATGTSSRIHCKGKKLQAEQNLENTRLKQSLESSISTVSSSSVLLINNPGRRSRGFLSLICKNSNSDNEKDSKSNSSRTQKPHIPSPKPCLNSCASSRKDSIKVPCTLLPESVLSTVEDSHVCEDTNEPSAKYLYPQVPRGEDPEEAISHRPDSESEKEPTRVSEYFFNDIFMEVNEKN